MQLIFCKDNVKSPNNQHFPDFSPLHKKASSFHNDEATEK